MSDLLLKAFDNEKAANLPTVQIGDNVTVYVRINVGDKNERVQMVRGTIIRVRNAGNNANFTVRRIASNGIGVERTFLANSPRIEKIEEPWAKIDVITPTELIVHGRGLDGLQEPADVLDCGPSLLSASAHRQGDAPAHQARFRAELARRASPLSSMDAGGGQAFETR